MIETGATTGRRPTPSYLRLINPLAAWRRGREVRSLEPIGPEAAEAHVRAYSTLVETVLSELTSDAEIQTLLEQDSDFFKKRFSTIKEKHDQIADHDKTAWAALRRFQGVMMNHCPRELLQCIEEAEYAELEQEPDGAETKVVQILPSSQRDSAGPDKTDELIRNRVNWKGVARDLRILLGLNINEKDSPELLIHTLSTWHAATEKTLKRLCLGKSEVSERVSTMYRRMKKIYRTTAKEAWDGSKLKELLTELYELTSGGYGFFLDAFDGMPEEENS